MKTGELLTISVFFTKNDGIVFPVKINSPSYVHRYAYVSMKERPCTICHILLISYAIDHPP